MVTLPQVPHYKEYEAALVIFLLLKLFPLTPAHHLLLASNEYCNKTEIKRNLKCKVLIVLERN